jgi:Spy/CpxP family protein refolding chaperone
MKQIIYTTLTLLLVATGVLAQDARPTDVSAPPAGQPPLQDVRANFLRRLGLSQQQMQQIRRMNQARKPLVDDTQRRLREATRALDDAIYADQVVETDVQARLKEFQLAQADVARVRFMNELGVRRILTPEQLVLFRNLRRRFEEVRENPRANRSIMNNDRPNVRKEPTDAKAPQTRRPEF